MDNIILFLALFSLTATAAQVSLFRHWWQQLALALAIAGITYAFFPRAIQFSSTDIEALLANADAMLDMSVVLVLEAVLMLILALFMLREMYSVIAFPWRAVLLLQYLPMVSAVGVLCFYQVHVYQQGLQLDFDKIALVYGGAVAVAVVVLAWLIKFLVPMRVLRLELKLAMHAAQIVIAVAVSVLTATYPYRSADIQPNLVEFAAVTALILVGVLVGYLRYQRNMQKLLMQER
ncbi:MAG: hypothetical protein OEV47_07355 [Gammaproteobacteria bacterium]|nr:hypothetical protein [Gammaproteobacteria bacterium]